jgi:hypothetical protein
MAGRLELQVVPGGVTTGGYQTRIAPWLGMDGCGITLPAPAPPFTTTVHRGQAQALVQPLRAEGLEAGAFGPMVSVPTSCDAWPAGSSTAMGG